MVKGGQCKGEEIERKREEERGGGSGGMRVTSGRCYTGRDISLKVHEICD